MSGIRVVRRDDGLVPLKWGGQPRRCTKCGTVVTSYKQPRRERVMCYCCEDKMPWTFENLGPNRTQGKPKGER